MKKSGYSENNLHIDWNALEAEGRQLAKIKPIEKTQLTNTQRKVLATIVANPGITFSQICDSLVISSAISISLRRLAIMGLIRKERKAQHVHYYVIR